MMLKFVHKIESLIIAVIVCLVFAGCIPSGDYSLQKQYKNDTYYFLALKQLRYGNTKEAARLFSITSKKGTDLCRRKSREELVKLGNVQERNAAAEKLIEIYNDEKALLIGLYQLIDSKEYSKVIYYTDNIDLEKDNNKIISFRLQSSLNKSDFRFKEEFKCWMLNRPFSEIHYNFFNLNFGENPEKLEMFDDETKNLFYFRMSVYKRDYLKSYKLLNDNKEAIFKVPCCISDAGKACLYGSSEYFNNAKIFQSYSNNEINISNFYICFYAARLYEKAGEYFTLAQNCYKKAMENACDGKNYDNALWYLLNLNLRVSTDKGISSLKKYCNKWHNCDYFDDYLDMLVPILLTEGKYQEFYELYKALDSYASDEIVSRYAFIYGRLISKKIISPENSNKLREEAFFRALKSGTQIYYKILAANELGLDDETLEKKLCNSNIINSKVDVSEEILLNGYAVFGFPEKIYDEFIESVNSNRIIGFNTAKRLAAFLQECGSNNNIYYSQSLRIMAKACSSSNRELNKDDMKLLYPKDYSLIIDQCSEKYNIPAYILYALIRSESYFNSSVYSSAGAKGLTQLMDSTASDIAKKLKFPEYSLLNPEQNVEFGTYYLSEMYSRVGGSWLSAFLSYNSGITRVRRWIKDNTFPIELVLEMLPFEESRGYGRKLVGSSMMYGWIYENMKLDEIEKVVF